ncbi:MAG: NUDIX hydrolase [Kangiellaceae bacterium]|nr:NUDIX hydrolase [Kangiellaceae bacterium]
MKRIYILLKRTGYQLAYLGWRVFRRFFVKSTQGAQVAVWKGDQVLLVKASYRHQYSFPGGYIDKGETPIQCAQRELQEETGLSLSSIDPNLFYEFEQSCGKTHCKDTIFEARLDEHCDEAILELLSIDGAEITDAKFLSIIECQALPLDHNAISYFQKKNLLPTS